MINIYLGQGACACYPRSSFPKFREALHWVAHDASGGDGGYLLGGHRWITIRVYCVLYTVYCIQGGQGERQHSRHGQGDDDGQDLDDSEEKSTTASSSQASRSEKKNPWNQSSAFRLSRLGTLGFFCHECSSRNMLSLTWIDAPEVLSLSLLVPK